MRFSVRFKLVLLINLLVVPLVAFLSVVFYQQFKAALDERTLLHLSSIQQLKKIQIEDYIEEKRKVVAEIFQSQHDPLPLSFEDSVFYVNTSDKKTLERLRIDIDSLRSTTGIQLKNACFLTKNGKASVLFWQQANDTTLAVCFSRLKNIQQILDERTGMGQTGESYLVGPDRVMLSKSRFFPSAPKDIQVNTEGVRKAQNGKKGMGIFPDYRNISVYSVFQRIEIPELNWVILTEIDKEEVLSPLNDMKQKLVLISCLMLIFTGITSFFLAKIIVAPLVRMKTFLTEMAKGKFNIYVREPRMKDEIYEMFNALQQLLQSINGAKNFADSIENFDFEQNYEPLSKYDTLGNALLRMRDKLLEYKEKEELFQLETQKALLEGQDKEQFRLSKELHDGLGPLLTTLKITIQSLPISEKEINHLTELLDETINEVRRMTYNLMPQALIDFGVGPSLLKFVETVKSASGIDIKYVSSFEPGRTIAPEINMGLYRIAQEALNNSVKHADATEIKLSITEFEDKVSFFFKDNGKGFDIDEVELGSGILNMQERCRVLEGEFFLDSDKNGTTIEIEIPKSSTSAIL
ncbi:histidine kinase [Flammeovirgaceae bacterium SG7u.111]|nr:histidine kinase [Flammeovirgaceae bacterium SG7u.132]WPO32992.1 histidine kinase [Flammeovirgaceae bacterium SG7u.111]